MRARLLALGPPDEEDLVSPITRGAESPVAGGDLGSPGLDWGERTAAARRGKAK